MANLFVAGLAWHTQEDTLRQEFGKYGTIVEATVIRDRDNPTRSKGYGFVRFATEGQANEAMAAMNGVELDGRTIRVDKAQDNGRGGRGRGAGRGAVANRGADYGGPPPPGASHGSLGSQGQNHGG